MVVENINNFRVNNAVIFGFTCKFEYPFKISVSRPLYKYYKIRFLSNKLWGPLLKYEVHQTSSTNTSLRRAEKWKFDAKKCKNNDRLFNWPMIAIRVNSFAIFIPIN